MPIIEHVPSTFDELCGHWDKGITDGAGDYDLGVLIGRKRDNFFILDLVRRDWSAGKRDDIIDLTASLDLTEYGDAAYGGERRGWRQSAEISMKRRSACAATG
ncbi:MAG: hypothetical protein AB7F89_13200 [Pirellulaceae bacterium]